MVRRFQAGKIDGFDGIFTRATRLERKIVVTTKKEVRCGCNLTYLEVKRDYVKS